MTDETRDRVLDGLLREAARARRSGTEEFVSRIMSSLEEAPAAARATRHPRRLLWAAAAACLVAVAGSLAFNHYRSIRFAERIVAHVERTAPGVSIRRRGVLVIVRVGMPLLVGDDIETGPDQDLLFAYPGEETRVRVNGISRVRLGREGRGKKLLLQNGNMEAVVAPQSEDQPMAIVTPHAEMTVLGTAFTVRASEDVTGLSVREGTVRMELPESGVGEDVTVGRVALARAGSHRVMMPGKLIRTVCVEGLAADARISGVAVADDAVWIHGSRGASAAPILAGIDPATGKVLRELHMKEDFKAGSCLAWDDGLLWGFSGDGASLRGIDVRSGETARAIPLPARELSSSRIFAVRDGIGWFRGKRRDEVVKVDLAGGRILARLTCPFPIDRLAVSESSVYAGERGWNACRIGPVEGRTIYAFLCEAESFTGDMSVDRHSNLWVARGTGPVIHVFEAE